MIFRCVGITSFGLALFATVAAAEPTSPAGGGRPLPHPDILVLPADPQALPASPAERSAADAGPVGPAAPDVDSSEGREIARRETALTPDRFGNNETRTVARRESAGSPGLIRDLWPLLVVLVLVAAIALFLKKFIPARRLMSGSQVLRIVARTHVTPKQQLMLVKLGRRMVLLGVSPERINTLSTVDDPDQVASLLGEAASSQDHSSSQAFAESMREEAGAYADPSDEDATSATRGQVRGLLEKVRSLAGKTG